MFEKFTERARELVQTAQDILARYKHTQLDTEHLLLAMLEQNDGLAVQVLQKLERGHAQPEPGGRRRPGARPESAVRRLRARRSISRRASSASSTWPKKKRSGCRTATSASSICCWAWSKKATAARPGS